MRLLIVLIVCVAFVAAEKSKIRARNLRRRAAGCSGNKLTNCEAYGHDICSNSDYTAWVAENCCAFCKSGSSSTGGNTDPFTLSFGTQAPMTSGGACADALPNCASYTSSMCTDSNYAQWVDTNCKKFCNKCSGGSAGGSYPIPQPGHTSTTCTDKLANCASYGQSVCTNADYTQWASTNCPKYCGKCSGFSAGGGIPSPTTGSTGNGGFMGSSTGCVYKNKLHHQGETWKDGCTYSCTCTDGTTGRYDCTALCVTWNLPSQCSMNPPAPGKCCKTPNCPTGFTLQYPPGYVEN